MYQTNTNNHHHSKTLGVDAQPSPTPPPKTKPPTTTTPPKTSPPTHPINPSPIPPTTPTTQKKNTTHSKTLGVDSESVAVAIAACGTVKNRLDRALEVGDYMMYIYVYMCILYV